MQLHYFYELKINGPLLQVGDSLLNEFLQNNFGLTNSYDINCDFTTLSEK